MWNKRTIHPVPTSPLASISLAKRLKKRQDDKGDQDRSGGRVGLEILSAQSHHQQQQQQQQIVKEQQDAEIIENNINKKQVRFAARDKDKGENSSVGPVKTEILGPLLVPSSEMSPEERNDIWWNDADYDFFHGTARMIANEINRRDVAVIAAASKGKGKKGTSTLYGNILTSVFASCCHASDDTDVTVVKNPLSQTDSMYLTHWVRVGHSRRGLERWSVSAMAKERQAKKNSALRGVLKEQQNAKERGINGEHLAETIRKASERYTRPARIFALTMGEADAAAARSFYDTATDKPHPSVTKIPKTSHATPHETHSTSCIPTDKPHISTSNAMSRRVAMRRINIGVGDGGEYALNPWATATAVAIQDIPD